MHAHHLPHFLLLRLMLLTSHPLLFLLLTLSSFLLFLWYSCIVLSAGSMTAAKLLVHTDRLPVLIFTPNS